MVSVALFGAGGKMGGRIIQHLREHPGYHLLCVENSSTGLERLAGQGIRSTPPEVATSQSEVVILAVPDRVLGKVANELVPTLRPGTIVVTLDPAAAHAGELPERSDVSYFVTHPCHTSVFDHFQTEQEVNDFFGGTHARQAVVCALMQGPEEHYAIGEQLARDIYAPVTRAHRVTVEQMAIMEPTMAETCGIALVRMLREVMEEAVRRGVPRAAAEDFMYGHIKVLLGIAFSRVDFPFSDGAILISEFGKRVLINPQWRDLFEPSNVLEQVRSIVAGRAPDSAG